MFIKANNRTNKKLKIKINNFNVSEAVYFDVSDFWQIEIIHYLFLISYSFYYAQGLILRLKGDSFLHLNQLNEVRSL